MSLRFSYTLLSPVYDLVAGPLFKAARRHSLSTLPRVPALRLVSDEPALAGGWFRRIRLERL